MREDASPRDANQAAEDDEMAKATEFLQLRTVKVRAAVTPAEREKRVRMREAQRNLRGVTLQYMEDDIVTFDDVAGIGDAKVCACPAHVAQLKIQAFVYFMGHGCEGEP